MKTHISGMPSARTLAAAAAAATILLSGCSWFQTIEIDPTKDWTPNQLYAEARGYLSDGNWTEAKSLYTKLEARYPFGAYAQQAQIDISYCYWKDGDQAQALQTLDRFLRAYPNHPNLDYALYLKALVTLNQRSSFMAIITNEDFADRDAQAVQDAFDTLKELVVRFPESRYTKEGRRRMHELVLAQARHELQTAQFYYDRYAYQAAIERAKTVITDFQLTPYSDDALEMIAKCYGHLGLPELEADTRRVIELNKNRDRSRELPRYQPAPAAASAKDGLTALQPATTE